MAILLVVVAILVVSYASSMRAYLRQHQHLVDLRNQIAESQKQIDQMQKDKLRFNDPAYVQQLARERFGWVMPGQTSYQVLGSNGLPVAPAGELDTTAAADKTVPQAWWAKAGSSFSVADNPQKAKPAPLKTINP